MRPRANPALERTGGGRAQAPPEEDTMAVTGEARTTQARDDAREAASGAKHSDATSVALSTEERLELYRKMVQIRIFEEATQRAFREGKIGGYLHVYIGQEAVATGFIETYEPGDRIITAYRDHAHALLLGSDPNAVMAELYGKGTGLVKGKGGSMHLFDEPHGLMGGYGIVGGHIPLGVGMAYAQRYQGSRSLVQLYFGDGAIHNGAFHEAANLAGLWGKSGMNPTLFILENNQYGMGTSIERATAMTDLGAKFDSYGIAHEEIDGMDVEAVIACARRVTKEMRETGKPYAINVITYRTVPHGAGDFFERYRTKEEIDKWRKRDPIGLLEHKLVEGGTDEATLEKIRDEQKVIVDAALKFSDESPEPDLSELTTDVYVEE
jgi:pyruvate dehydrogenase E1 component alpha subunit